MEVSVYNLRQVWESERVVDFTYSSIHLVVGVFGFTGTVEREYTFGYFLFY
jgi:hypothetical protein